jgi:hypothetical protein
MLRVAVTYRNINDDDCDDYDEGGIVEGTTKTLKES